MSFSELVVAGVVERLKIVLAWAAVIGCVAAPAFYLYMRVRDQVASPAHQFVVACRAVDGMPFQATDGTLSCFSAPGAGKVLK